MQVNPAFGSQLRTRATIAFIYIFLAFLIAKSLMAGSFADASLELLMPLNLQVVIFFIMLPLFFIYGAIILFKQEKTGSVHQDEKAAKPLYKAKNLVKAAIIYVFFSIALLAMVLSLNYLVGKDTGQIKEGGSFFYLPDISMSIPSLVFLLGFGYIILLGLFNACQILFARLRKADNRIKFDESELSLVLGALYLSICVILAITLTAVILFGILVFGAMGFAEYRKAAKGRNANADKTVLAAYGLPVLALAALCALFLINGAGAFFSKDSIFYALGGGLFAIMFIFDYKSVAKAAVEGGMRKFSFIANIAVLFILLALSLWANGAFAALSLIYVFSAKLYIDKLIDSEKIPAAGNAMH